MLRVETAGRGNDVAMAEDERPEQEENAELLPPREVMSLLNTDPSAYAGLLGDPTAAGATPDAGATSGDPTAGLAGSTLSQAQGLAGAHAAGDGTQNVTDQPQTLTTDTTDTASSET
jgi:hypothetical protein